MSLAKLSGLLAALALCAAPPATAADAELQSGFAKYVEQAQALVTALDAGAPAAEQHARLQSLTDQAAALIPPFSARYPVCRDYLAGAAELADTWSHLSLENIERDYHHDGALPKIESAQDRGLCYQMKDLLVHPLTGLRLLQETPVDQKALRHEIVEVVAHGSALQALTARKD